MVVATIMQFTKSDVLNHCNVNGEKSYEEKKGCHGNLKEQYILKPRITSESGGKPKAGSRSNEQIAFTFQVFFILFTEYLLLRFPKYFQIFYCVMFPFFSSLDIFIINRQNGIIPCLKFVTLSTVAQ